MRKTTTLLALSLAALAPTAFAGTVIFDGNIIEGSQAPGTIANVDVLEVPLGNFAAINTVAAIETVTATPIDFGFGVGYFVDIDDSSDAEIYRFAVSNNANSPIPFAIPSDWGSSSHTESSWNSNFGNALGSFDSFFDPGEKVSMFSYQGMIESISAPSIEILEQISLGPINASNDFDLDSPLISEPLFGFYNGNLASQAVAFDVNGGVISQSKAVGTVPDGGSTAGMLGLVLLAFGAKRRFGK